MKGLFLKDLYNMKLSAKTLVATCGMLTVFGVMLNSPTYILCLLMFMSLSISISSVCADEKCHWEPYALTLPVTRRQIVLEKMASMVCYLLAGSTVGLAISLVMTVVNGEELTMLLMGFGFALGVILILQSIIFPLLLKLGSENARYILMGVVAIPAVIFIVSMKYFKVSEEWLDAFINKWIGSACLGLILAGMLSLLISYFVSVRIYAKKEW